MKKTKHIETRDIGPNQRDVLLSAIQSRARVSAMQIGARLIVLLTGLTLASDCVKMGGPPVWQPTAFPSVVLVGFEQHQLAGHADARSQVDADDLAFGGVLDPR